MRKKIYYIFALFILTCILVLFFRKTCPWPVFADEVSNLPIAADFFSGNFFLEGWHFSTGLFLAPTFELWIMTNIFGYRNGVIYAVSAINWSLLVCVLVWEILSYAEKYKANKWFFATITWLLISVPVDLVNLNAGTHVLIIAISIIIFGYFDYLQDKLLCQSITTVMCLAVVSAFLGMTNTMFQYSCIMPVFFGAFIFWKNNRVFSKLCLLYSTLSFALMKMMEKYWIYKRHGMTIGSVKATFINGDQLGETILNMIIRIGRMFHIDMWGHSVFSPYVVASVIGFIILFFLINRVNIFFRQSERNYPAIVYFCLLMALINVFANTLGTVSFLYDNTRLHLYLPFYIGFVFSGIFAWMCIGSKDNYSDKRLYINFGILVLVFWCIGAHTTVDYHRHKWLAIDYQTVTNHLIKNNLMDGYGNYLLCSTVECQGKNMNNNIKMVPLAANEKGEISPMIWLIKEAQIQKKKNFYLALYEPTYSNWNVSEENLVKSFGEWKDKKDFGGGVVLYVWDRPFLAGGARPFERLQSRMRIRGQKDNKDRDAGNEEITIAPAELLFSPHIALLGGRYSLRVDVTSNGTFDMEIIADGGKKRIGQFTLVNGVNHCNFILDSSYTKDVQFIVNNNDGREKIVVKDVYFEEMPNE